MNKDIHNNLEKSEQSQRSPVFKDDDKILNITEQEQKERAKKNREILEKETNKEEKRRKITALSFLGAGMVILVIYIVYSLVSSSPLDRITRYEVQVEPQQDGALNITYRLEWLVLNDSREGPLEWVKIGMANPNYTILETGGAITSEHNDISENSYNHAMFDLDRAYQKGETAKFWFTVRQDNMILINHINSGYDETYNDYGENTSVDRYDLAYGNYDFLYEFAPGWFDNIKVDSYFFTWMKSSLLLTNNADREEGDSLIWEGSLDFGEKRIMMATYSKDAFENPQGGNGSTYYPFNDASSQSSVDPRVIFLIIAVSVIIALRIYFPQTGYRGGRGFFWHGHGGHGGGGCACACAGCACACACACAGGGRAGCSAKDFYSAPAYKWDLEEVCKKIRQDQD